MMNFREELKKIKESGDWTRISDFIPYARVLGIETHLIGDSLVSILPYQKTNIGNPGSPALHGGVIGGFMENAALFQLVWDLEPEEIPKTIDFSIDFLRPGQADTTYTKCEITRQGRRIALCNLTAWQREEDKPIAMARAHFLLSHAPD